MINKSFSSLSKEDILNSLTKNNVNCPIYIEVSRLTKMYSDFMKPHIDRTPQLLDTILTFNVNTNIEKVAISQCYRYLDSQINDNEHKNYINVDKT